MLRSKSLNRARPASNSRNGVQKAGSVAGVLCTVLMAALFCAASPVVASTASAQEPAGGPRDGTVDPVLAVVNGVPIRRSEMMEATRNLSPEFKQLPLEMVYPVLIERMIDIRLLAARGRESGLDQDPEVKRKIYEKTQEIMQEVYLNRYVSKFITEDGLRDRYSNYVDASGSREVAHVYQILVANREKAMELIKKLEQGGNFAELARENSLGPDRVRGGDLGFVGKGDMTPEFVTAALNLQPNQLAPVPVQTDFGWHVVKVTEKKVQPAPPFEEIRERLVKEWSAELIAEHVKQLRDKANIERFDYKPGRLEQKDGAVTPAERKQNYASLSGGKESWLAMGEKPGALPRLSPDHRTALHTQTASQP